MRCLESLVTVSDWHHSELSENHRFPSTSSRFEARRVAFMLLSHRHGNATVPWAMQQNCFSRGELTLLRKQKYTIGRWKIQPLNSRSIFPSTLSHRHQQPPTKNQAHKATPSGAQQPSPLTLISTPTGHIPTA